MRPTQLTGRPGSRVIPPNWGRNHQPVLETTMLDATCELRPPGSQQLWDPDLEEMVAVPKSAYYAGGCRIQAMTNDARQAVAADDPETVTRYLITLPAGVDEAAIGHLLKVTASDDDALTGRSLTVADVILGSHRFERDLICTLTT